MEKRRNCSFFSTIFCYLLFDFRVEEGTRFPLRDNQLFEIREDEITRVNCMLSPRQNGSRDRRICVLRRNRIKVLTALVGRLSEYRLKMVLKGDLRLFQLTFNFLSFKQTVQTLIRRQCPEYPSPSFIDKPLSTALRRHSDKNSAAIINRYLEFV